MKKNLPSRETALKLLKQVGCSKKVVEHCIAVAAYATKVAEIYKKKGLKVNVDLVHVGALLHDVGRAKTHGVNHGACGAQIARGLGMPPAVVSIIGNHVGGGITEAEARKLGLPKKSYIPDSVEARIVAYADKLVEGSTILPIEAAVKRFRQDSNIPEDSVKRLKQWHREFSNCAK